MRKIRALCYGLWLTGAGCALPPVTCQQIVRQNPNYNIYIVSIRLSDARIFARVARGGPPPPDNTNWTTTLLPVREIAQREGFDIAINGDFFTAQATRDVEGRNTGYIRGKWASPEGMAMTDGQLWHRPEKPRVYLAITTHHTARLERDNPPTRPIAPDICQIIGGGQIIEQDGQAVEFKTAFATNRNPRTVVGLNRDGTRLTLLVVDGRQPKLSLGMTLHELSEEMIRLGCASAINLDGGGSTTLVYRDPATHALKVLNSPSDGKERSVADVLGFIVHAPMQEPKH